MSYQSDSEIENVVRGFESCETDPDEFKHPEHLVVAVYYLQALKREAALDRMRTSLMRFLDHHGVDRKQYNETITVFWLNMVAAKLNSIEAGVSFVERCNAVVASMNNKLVLEYYSPEHLWSDEARRTFVAPDLRALAG